MEVKNICEVTTLNEMPDNANLFINDSGLLSQLPPKGLGEVMFPVGSCYTTNTNSSPANYLGGTWELIDKVFEDVLLTDTDTNTLFTPTSNTGGYSITALRGGHSIRFRIDIAPTIVFTDSAFELGTLNLTEFGVNSFAVSYYSLPLQGDAGNGSAMLNVSHNGVLTVTDIVKTNTVNKDMSTNFFSVFRKNNMFDEAYNQYIWKRVS